jgi:hypothetical protein
MIRKIVLLACALLGTVAFAQPRFVPDSEIKKTGEVLFQKPHTIVFGFTNRGNKPLHIKKVHSSCGCTKVNYTRGNIAPGARGEITVEYDAGMLGTFSKHVEVYTNEGKEPEFLVFQGRVVRELSDYATGFPIDLGNVRINTNYVEFDNVRKGERLATELKVVNTERTAYKPELMHLPPYLQVENVPEVIPGGQVGTIRLILDSDKLSSYGLNQTSLYLARYSGDKISETNEIVVSSVLLPQASSSLSAGGVVKLSDDEIIFNRNAKKMKAIVTVTNDGKMPLSVHSLQVFNHAVEVSLSNRVIQPGKSAKLKVSVKKNLLGRFKARPRVLIVSDDANTPVKTLNIVIGDK